jgi:hypothetical protein
MRNLGALQYAHLLQAKTIGGMAQKLGVTWPPPPAVSVRNLLRLAGDLVATRPDVVKGPWAVLLCKFSDDSLEPFQRKFYEDLFTISGTGTMNLTDFFRDASHRKLDVSESKVFGWCTLSQKRSEYLGSGANPEGREDLVKWAKQKTIEDNPNNPNILDPYPVLVVCTNMDTDLCGTSGWAICGTGPHPTDGTSGASPGVVGQEIGHGYGLQHSRPDNVNDSPLGSGGPPLFDYGDAWDIMSTRIAYMAPMANMPTQDQQGRRMRFVIGPMLNAANMASRGWLNESRVWKLAGSGPETVILRPLAYPNLPGWIAARIGDYLVEFRVNEGWDANVNIRSAVLVHRFQDNSSYIMSGTNHNQDLVAGDVFQVGDPAANSPWTKVEVLNIDAAGYTATVRLSTG